MEKKSKIKINERDVLTEKYKNCYLQYNETFHLRECINRNRCNKVVAEIPENKFDVFKFYFVFVLLFLFSFSLLNSMVLSFLLLLVRYFCFKCFIFNSVLFQIKRMYFRLNLIRDRCFLSLRQESN